MLTHLCEVLRGREYFFEIRQGVLSHVLNAGDLAVTLGKKVDGFQMVLVQTASHV